MRRTVSSAERSCDTAAGVLSEPHAHRSVQATMAYAIRISPSSNARGTPNARAKLQRNQRRVCGAAANNSIDPLSASAFVRWRLVIADRPRPERCVRVRRMAHRWRVTAKHRRSAHRAARRTSTARQCRRRTPDWRAARYMTRRCRRRDRRSAADLHRLEDGTRDSAGSGGRVQ